jgi:RNA polymerase sigma-70 factor, ECF subfamily
MDSTEHSTADGTGDDPAGTAGGGDERADPAGAAARRDTELDGLAGLAAAGNRAALGELLQRIRTPVFRFCVARMGSRGVGQLTPEDVTQEVLIAVCAALPRYRPADTRWLAFVFGIARNKVADAFRAAHRDRSDPVEDLPEGADDDRGPEAAALVGADAGLLRELLETLPEHHREVLVLRIALRYSAEEVALIVGSTAGAVRVTQHRALARLRKVIAQRLEES